LAGVFPVDKVTIKWFRNRVDKLEITRFDNKNLPPTQPGQNFIHPKAKVLKGPTISVLNSRIRVMTLMGSTRSHRFFHD